MAVANDYLQLIAQANRIFQQAYGDAFTFGATGRPQAGLLAKTADELTNWTFIARTDAAFAQLEYANDAFGVPTAEEGPYLGLEFVPLPQGTIRLPEAIKILNEHGYTQGFTSVSLGTPVVFHPPPMFWFCVNQQTQGVSASTGDFSQDLYLVTSVVHVYPTATEVRDNAGSGSR